MASDDVVGLVPCGGHAARLAPLPCSKEVLPVGTRRMPDGSLRSKVVSHYLLEKMAHAGVGRAFLILRSGKWDIPDYYRDGHAFGLDLGYLVTRLPYGAPYTLDQAYSFVRGSRVAFGFPDIVFGPRDAFARALQQLSAARSDLVLGLYRAHPGYSDLVAVERTGRVVELVINRRETKLELGWVFAVWDPPFTEFLHDYLRMPRTSGQEGRDGLPAELSVGHVIQAALREGLRIDSVTFPSHDYLDVGTPEGLQQALAGARKHELGMEADDGAPAATQRTDG
jgi:glucose-1-phosphate thymidylyltransferase